jgi:hypothetical protein
VVRAGVIGAGDQNLIVDVDVAQLSLRCSHLVLIN